MVPLNDLVPVPIASFRNVTRDIDFDVFLKLSEENVAHVFSKTTGLDYKRLAAYIQKGVSHLYVREVDLPLYKAFIARPAHVIFADPATTPEKKIATLLNMTEQNMSEIFSQVTVREETAADSQRLVKSYVDLMTENPQSLAVILKLVSHGEYLYYHSIAVSIFSLFIAKATGQFNRKMLEIIGLGGFLHDIGCTQLPKDLVDCPAEYTPEQWGDMQMHAKIGLDMIANTPNLPDEVRYIVYQHHEEPGGHGYPNSLYGPSIYYPAKIVALADAFSALISKRPYRPAYTAEQAIYILQSEEGRKDKALVDILANIILYGGRGREAA
jgi:putative nucleotidyltransferase with HDIG domain